MKPHASPRFDQALRLKESSGWFAAGRSFGQAMQLLSDGSFKLFAHICLEADRRTGRFMASQKDLAAAMGKSRRIIGCYVKELQSAGICSVNPARNQHGATSFEIRDAFWPYHRAEGVEDPPELRQYLESVRESFLGLGCTSGNFGAPETATARDLYRRRIPLGIVDEAMLLAACRKYVTWLNGRESGPIQSLSYFADVIQEIQQQPLPPGYSCYLRRKIKQFSAAWTSRKQAGSPAPAEAPARF